MSTGHSSHDVSPLVSWKYPAGHVSHSPSLLPYLPRSLEEDEKNVGVRSEVRSEMEIRKNVNKNDLPLLTRSATVLCCRFTQLARWAWGGETDFL